MIYGEEQKGIDFSKGLWLADDLDAVPDGYCANLVNLISNKAGGLELRPNFLPVTNYWTSVSFTLSNLTNLTPTYPAGALAIDFSSRTCANHSAFDLIATLAYHPVLATFELESGSGNAYWVCADGTVTNQAISTAIPHEFAQYRDRYYCIEKTFQYMSSVYRYDFTSGYSVTRSTVGSALSSTGLNCLVTFRDRLFASAAYSNRIYYTDLATTGGYPETWSTNQFFDVPESGAIVKRMFIANDRMYIFTTKGIFQLYASGNPSTWSIIPITRDIRINFYEDVNYIDGVFVFTDRKSVYIYNGSTSVEEVGQPIRNALRAQVNDYAIPLQGSVQKYVGPSAFKFFPFLDGFIFACYHYTNGGAGTLVTSSVNKYYYFDGVNWSEIQFDTDLSGANKGHYDLLCTARKKPLKTYSTEQYRLDDCLVELRYNSSTSSVVFMAKTIRDDNQDIDIGNHQTDFGIFTKDTEYAYPNVVRFKEVRVDARLSTSGITMTPYTDGDVNTSYTPVVTTVGMKKFRVPVSIERGNSISMSISGSLTKTTGPGGDQSQHSWPSVRINRISPVVNTDTRKIPDQAYDS